MRSFFKNIVLVTAAIALFSCGNKKPDAPPATGVPVNIYQVAPEKPAYYEKFPGTVVALMQVDLRPEVEGYVTGIFFKEGTHVKKGQTLYTIDDSKYMANVNGAKANVSVAESNLDQAQKDADRYTYLNQHEAIAKQLLDHAMTTLQNAKNQVTAAKQDLKKAQTDLGYSTIRAPFDGTIGISQVKIGTSVVVGQTILNTISTDNPMAVDFVVNEKQIPRFQTLQHNKVQGSDSLFTLALPDNTIYDHMGEISVIDRGVNPQTGSIIVRLVFANPAGTLKTGMSCTVRVRNDDTGSQLLVPSKAIVEQMGEYFVYTVKDTTLPKAGEGANGNQAPPPVGLMRAVQHKVILGQTIADRVIVKSGIGAGDRVIVEGVQKVNEGSLVKPGGAPKPDQGHKP